MLISTRLRRCVSFLALLALGCSNDDGPSPYGADGLGAYCASNYDCGTGFCCDTPACGHGTCSYRCASDLDCPYGALCEGGWCFVGCRSNVDCHVTQKCKGRGVCQY